MTSVPQAQCYLAENLRQQERERSHTKVPAQSDAGRTVSPCGKLSGPKPHGAAQAAVFPALRTGPPQVRPQAGWGTRGQTCTPLNWTCTNTETLKLACNQQLF